MAAHDVEAIKAASARLRGSLLESLADPVTGALREDDQTLIKYHGSYQQDDRDVREARRQALLEPAYAFMIRTRTPGGVVTPSQWLQLDALATTYAERGLRITTRQAFQFHGVIKTELKATMQAINAALIDTLAACGDVNRNVAVAANPHASSLHAAVYAQAAALSAHLLPNSRAYYEIWLDEERVAGSGSEDEPIYGDRYLPRKFKIGFAVPPSNDVDVFAQDLGFIAIVDDDGALAGYDVTVGGGMGATHGDPETYPRLGSVIGFVTPAQVIAVAEAVVTAQRDHGNRALRKRARLKYTIDDHGLDWFRSEIERRAGVSLPPARPFAFSHVGDRFGWVEGDDGRSHLTLRIVAGRIVDGALDAPAGTARGFESTVESHSAESHSDSDSGSWQLPGPSAVRHRGSSPVRHLSGLRAIAHLLAAEGDGAEFRLTPNQNLTLARVPQALRTRIDALCAEHGLDGWRAATPLRRDALACVALPSCGLAMAEAERYLPTLLDRVEALLTRHGLREAAIGLRISGCPNGCSRPYLGEIALVGKAPGRYNLMLGADHLGQRLNALYRENVDEAQLLAALDPLLADYAAARAPGERFGDFLVRRGVVTIPERDVRRRIAMTCIADSASVATSASVDASVSVESAA